MVHSGRHQFYNSLSLVASKQMFFKINLDGCIGIWGSHQSLGLSGVGSNLSDSCGATSHI